MALYNIALIIVDLARGLYPMTRNTLQRRYRQIDGLNRIKLGRFFY